MRPHKDTAQALLCMHQNNLNRLRINCSNHWVSSTIEYDEDYSNVVWSDTECGEDMKA